MFVSLLILPGLVVPSLFGTTMNAYPTEPIFGPDGWYHVAWVWRNTSDAATNHDISYARSRDLKIWETCDGRKAQLPIGINTAGTIIDPVPIYGGTLNSRVYVGFDSKNRVTVSYMKYDENNKSQVYNARLEGCTWSIFKTTQWETKWNFGGGGSLPCDEFCIRFSSVRTTSDGRVYQYLRRATADTDGFPESGGWQLNESLQPIQPISVPSIHPSLPYGWNNIENSEMILRYLWARSDDADYHALIKWETMATNRDQPLEGEYYSKLYFYEWDSFSDSWKERTLIADVWAGSNPGFDIIYRRGKVYFTYYDTDRKITLTYRDDNNQWVHLQLNTYFQGWDGHNYINMEMDQYGIIHLAGNMHVNPLNYFKIDPQINSSSKESMTGFNESQVTYPRFSFTTDDTLLFKYRDGYSGDGKWRINYLDYDTNSWKRYVENPWFAPGKTNYVNVDTKNEMVIGDFDGDQMDDIFVFQPGLGFAWVKWSDQILDYPQPEKYCQKQVGFNGYDFTSDNDKVISFDYNADGRKDLFAYRPGHGTVAIFSSDANRQWRRVFDGQNGIAGFNFQSSLDRVVPFDYNNDNYDDLFLYRPGGGVAFVVRSNGDGSFSTVYSASENSVISKSDFYGFDFYKEEDRAITLDYNKDGYDDLFFYRPGSGAAWLVKSNGNGSFNTVYAAGGNPTAPGIGFYGFDFHRIEDRVLSLDFDGDGDDDLFFYRPGSGLAWLVRSNGDGSFENEYTAGGSPGTPGHGFFSYDFSLLEDRAQVINFDNDNLDDLVLYRPGSGVVYIMRSIGNGQFEKTLSSGGGSPDNKAPGIMNNFGSTIIALNRPTDKLEVGDFNGDGISDFAQIKTEHTTIKTAIIKDNKFEIGACMYCIDDSGTPSIIDTDLDGMPNVWEIVNGLDPYNPDDALLDADNDGLSNYEEYLNKTNPQDPDSDNDEIDDHWEIVNGLNPLNSNDAQEDWDGDGYSNLEEYEMGYDPNDPDPPYVLFLVTPLASGTYTSIESIIARDNCIIESNIDVTFSTKGTIYLGPGFHAKAGSSFTAKISDSE